MKAFGMSPPGLSLCSIFAINITESKPRLLWALKSHFFSQLMDFFLTNTMQMCFLDMGWMEPSPPVTSPSLARAAGTWRAEESHSIHALAGLLHLPRGVWLNLLLPQIIVSVLQVEYIHIFLKCATHPRVLAAFICILLVCFVFNLHGEIIVSFLEWEALSPSSLGCLGCKGTFFRLFLSFLVH